MRNPMEKGGAARRSLILEQTNRGLRGSGSYSSSIQAVCERSSRSMEVYLPQIDKKNGEDYG